MYGKVANKHPLILFLGAQLLSVPVFGTGCIMWPRTRYLGLKMLKKAVVTSRICGLFCVTHSSFTHFQLNKDLRWSYCLKIPRIPNNIQTCVCTHNVLMVKSATALLLKDAPGSRTLSLSVSHVLIIYITFQPVVCPI